MNRIDRREFLCGLVGLGALELTAERAPGAAPRVAALPTVFFAAPDARTALVRFVAHGTDAPGGRLRVFDQARRQVGTAGMLGVGDRLYGELWLPLERESTFSTDLELPRVRGIIRTTHRIQPRQRWTLHWITLAEPPALDGAEYADHAAFLQSMGSTTGADPTPVSLEPSGTGAGLSSVPLLLAGIGVRWVVRESGDGAPAQLRSRDGSSVTLLPVVPGGTPADLGFFSGGEDMRRRVERWIESASSLQAPRPSRPVAETLVVGTSPADVAQGGPVIDEWNGRFAFPRIVVGRWEDFVSRLPPPAVTATGAAAARTPPDGARRAEIAAVREAERQARVDRLLAPLVTRLSSNEAGLAAVAAQFSFLVPGTLVFNPTPFTRSDLATMPDGTERVVTDVPGTGHVCVPYPGHQPEDGRGRAAADLSGRWVAGGDELVVRSPNLTVRVDPANGAIRSARGANDREWVGPSGPGWNAAEGFRLAQARPERNSLAGQRLILDRTGPNGARLTTTITVYDALPWLDIRNDLTSKPDEPPTYVFPFALDQPRISWEIPAGFDTGVPPVADLVHLRWIRLESGDDAVFFRGIDAPAASIDRDCILSSLAPAGISRYRLGFPSRFAHAEDTWRFGWSTEPFVTAAVPGTGRATLASYGSMILVDQSGIAILDLRAARDNDGIVVILQELLGASRSITLGAGLLAFSGGRRVDFLERDMGGGPLPDLGGRGISVPISGYGIVAVRLTGVGLAGD